MFKKDNTILELFEAININSYYEEAVSKVFKEISASSDPISYHKANIEQILTNIIPKVFKDNPSERFKNASVDLDVRNTIDISGQIDTKNNDQTEFLINVFIPASQWDTPLSDKSARAKMLLAKKIGRTFVHEVAHMIQFIKGFQKPTNDMKSRLSTITRPTIPKSSAKQFQMASQDTSLPDMERVKQARMPYYTMKHEISTHAIGAAQEIVDHVGSPEKALELFKNKNFDVIKSLYTKPENKNLFAFWYVVKQYPEGETAWKQFWKEVYKQISAMQ